MQLTGKECSNCLSGDGRNKSGQCLNCSNSEREPILIDANLLLDDLKERLNGRQQLMNHRIEPTEKQIVRDMARIDEIKSLIRAIEENPEIFFLE